MSEILENDNKKLMKRSLVLIISFFLFLVLNIIFFIYFQANELFMFNLHRSVENIPNPLTSQIFSTIFYAIVMIATIIYVVFLVMYLQKTYDSNFGLFKKVYNAADLFSVVPIFLFIIIVVNGFFFSMALVDGESMQPTFCDNDTVIISYQAEFERNDILIVENQDTFLIKRVVGLPGDQLVVDGTGVYINDVLVETYLNGNSIFYDTVIPEGFYYFLGDNRANSLDSRIIGMVREDLVLGEVIWKLTEGSCEID